MKKAYLFLLLVATYGAGCVNAPTPASVTPTTTSGQTANTQLDAHGMQQYTDLQYGFSFWYPSYEQVSSTKMQNTERFPGGTAVEALQVGPVDGPSIYVVESPSSTITDEPAEHASPISQTKYFYDFSTDSWMVTSPEDIAYTSSSATTTADISNKTVGGLIMLPTGLRFDASIIPLSKTRFLVISDGGVGLAPKLAKTVNLNGANLDNQALSNALQDEADAYKGYYSEEATISQPDIFSSNKIITSPLHIEGIAPGTWYFEANLPIQIVDANGKVLGSVGAQAQGEWMTESPVPFKADLTFATPTTTTGYLIIHNDNPSGLPQNDRQTEYPVKFK